MLIRMVLNSLHIKGDAQHENLIVVDPDASILDAAQLLYRNNIGVVLVCVAQRKLVGILSERDIVRGVSLHQDAIFRMAVSELMTPEPMTCTSEDDAVEVIKRMREGGFRHIPIVQGDEVVGMVSSTDILRYLSTSLTARQRDELWSMSIWV